MAGNDEGQEYELEFLNPDYRMIYIQGVLTGLNSKSKKYKITVNNESQPFYTAGIKKGLGLDISYDTIRKLTTPSKDIWNWRSEMFDEEMQKRIQVYINNFRREISDRIDDEVGQKITIVGFQKGVLVNVEQKRFLANNDDYIGVFPKMEDALKILEINMRDFLDAENLLAFEKKIAENEKPFERTKIFFKDESFFLIKGTDESFWSKQQAKENVETIAKHLNSLLAQFNEGGKTNIPNPSKPSI